MSDDKKKDPEILLSTLKPGDIAYISSDPEFVGVMPIRTELTVLPADEPKKLKLGWIVKETVGIGVINPFGMGAYNGYKHVFAEFSDHQEDIKKVEEYILEQIRNRPERMKDLAKVLQEHPEYHRYLKFFPMT